ncbi:MAG: hypothetical protein LUG12_00285 [Erysipelotrichaceae bacterium]|nr:hypothetical protein [Erysipelotrichaceae bacterium]
MKQFLINLVLVLFLMCLLTIFFGDHQVSQTMFQRKIDAFEESTTISSSYITIADTTDNNVSSLVGIVSQYCVYMIEFIGELFSNLISLFL